MAEREYVSNVVIRRLPLYYRYLETLEREGVLRISSSELGGQMGFTASQVRQDINCFGAFGQQGYGYNVKELKNHLGSILGLNNGYHMIVIGVGNIGQAIINYQSFYDRGFEIRALFDASPKRIGTEIRGMIVRDVKGMEEYLRQNRVDIAAICTPRDCAQQIADVLVDNGVRGLWNFAPVVLKAPEHVAVNHVHMTDSLMVLSYMLKHSEQK